MARLRAPSSSPVRSDGDESVAAVSPDPVPTPGTSQTSDKENRGQRSRELSRGEKRKSSDRSVADATLSESSTSASAKRRRVGPHSQAIHQRELEARRDKNYYDPDQDQDERRAVRKGIRELAKELNDSRAEFLQASSSGLYNTLTEADKYFKSVKQTSDATIDSRLLVSTADLSYKKTTQLALGDAATGIDIDDFVSRCISYMRRGPEDDGGQSQPPGSQMHRRRQTQRDPDSDVEDEEDAEELAYNWSYLGATACFPYNSRPCLSGFLLGPLSLQKRARVQSQRRARQPRANLANATRPTELTSEDIAATHETANLTQICDGIAKLLRKVQVDGQEKVEEEADDDMDNDEIQQIMQRHGVSDDGGVPLMHFCINPHSFGQTVENLFYVSFLIKEGVAGLNVDSRGFPTLHPHEPTPPQEAQAKGITKNQAVFALDFETWEDLIRAFNVTDSLIPHRDEEEYDDGTIATTMTTAAAAAAGADVNGAWI